MSTDGSDWYGPPSGVHSMSEVAESAGTRNPGAVVTFDVGELRAGHSAAHQGQYGHRHGAGPGGAMAVHWDLELASDRRGDPETGLSVAPKRTATW